MELIFYSAVLGIGIGVLLKYIFDKTKLYNNKLTSVIIIIIMIIGGLAYPGGLVINNVVVNANGGYMPNDENVLNEIGQVAINDYKHKNVYKNPIYPEWINKYYSPQIAKNKLYSKGDLISVVGIFFFFTTVFTSLKYILLIDKKETTEWLKKGLAH